MKNVMLEWRLNGSFFSSFSLIKMNHESLQLKKYLYIYNINILASFWVEANLCRFFYHLFKYVLPLEMQLSRGEFPLTSFTSPSPQFFCLSQARIGFPKSYAVVLFCVQWVKIRGGCLFCWYWWNSWPSLFKLSFHNFLSFKFY